MVALTHLAIEHGATKTPPTITPVRFLLGSPRTKLN